VDHKRESQRFSSTRLRFCSRHDGIGTKRKDLNLQTWQAGVDTLPDRSHRSGKAPGGRKTQGVAWEQGFIYIAASRSAISPPVAPPRDGALGSGVPIGPPS
jgi:hypothetical protein